MSLCLLGLHLRELFLITVLDASSFLTLVSLFVASSDVCWVLPLGWQGGLSVSSVQVLSRINFGDGTQKVGAGQRSVGFCYVVFAPLQREYS